MRRPICAFVVRIRPKQVFSWRGSFNDNYYFGPQLTKGTLKHLEIFWVVRIMATEILRHLICIKCWSCHRTKGSMATKSIHFEEIISQTHKRKVFLLIYLSNDVVLTRHVLHHTKMKGSNVKWCCDVPWIFKMTFSDLTNYTTLKGAVPLFFIEIFRIDTTWIEFLKYASLSKFQILS